MEGNVVRLRCSLNLPRHVRSKISEEKKTTSLSVETVSILRKSVNLSVRFVS